MSLNFDYLLIQKNPNIRSGFFYVFFLGDCLPIVDRLPFHIKVEILAKAECETHFKEWAKAHSYSNLGD